MSQAGPYNETVMDHFMNPRNMGEIPNADGVGEVGNPSCGDMMRLFLKIEDGYIKDVKFQTFGCGAAIASSSMLTEILKGKSLAEAKTVTNASISDALNGLPPAKIHCSIMAEEAIQKALEDYEKRHGKG